MTMCADVATDFVALIAVLVGRLALSTQEQEDDER